MRVYGGKDVLTGKRNELVEVISPGPRAAAEAEAAHYHGKRYVILRVARLETKPVCCEIRAPLEGKLALKPTVYLATFV